MPQPFLNGSILYSTTAWPFLPQKQIAVRSLPKERKHLSTPFQSETPLRQKRHNKDRFLGIISYFLQFDNSLKRKSYTTILPTLQIPYRKSDPPDRPVPTPVSYTHLFPYPIADKQAKGFGILLYIVRAGGTLRRRSPLIDAQSRSVVLSG